MPNFVNRLGYSDVEPYEVLGAVGKLGLRVRAMKAEALHKHEDLGFAPGGFFGHHARQDQQRWEIKPDPEAPEIVVRLCRAQKPGGRRAGFYYDRGGSRYQAADEPMKFYDFNF